MADYKHICCSAMIVQNSLQTSLATLIAISDGKIIVPLTENAPKGTMSTERLCILQTLLRNIILELGNVEDISKISHTLHRDYDSLNNFYSKIKPHLDFFNYLRNKFVAHIPTGITHQTLEWLPQAYLILGKTDGANQLMLSLFALETAINTYTSLKSGYKIFDSETDLQYPPDRDRFFDLLISFSESSINYLQELVKISKLQFDIPDIKADEFDFFKRAAMLKFEYVTKRGSR